jgi:hypothetical protein
MSCGEVAEIMKQTNIDLGFNYPRTHNSDTVSLHYNTRKTDLLNEGMDVTTYQIWWFNWKFLHERKTADVP